MPCRKNFLQATRKANVVYTSFKGLSKYIEELQSKAVQESQEKETLKNKLGQVESNLKSEMDKEITRLKTNHENKLKDELEKLALEGECWYSGMVLKIGGRGGEKGEGVVELLGENEHELV